MISIFKKYWPSIFLVLLPGIYLTAVYSFQQAWNSEFDRAIDMSRNGSLISHYKEQDSLQNTTIGYLLMVDIQKEMVERSASFTPNEINHFVNMAKQSVHYESSLKNPLFPFQKLFFSTETQKMSNDSIDFFDRRGQVFSRANEIGIKKWKEDLISIYAAFREDESPPRNADCTLVSLLAPDFPSNSKSKMMVHCDSKQHPFKTEIS
jgi:hypothetical protein